jgi:hypothetical protein
MIRFHLAHRKLREIHEITRHLDAQLHQGMKDLDGMLR